MKRLVMIAIIMATGINVKAEDTVNREAIYREREVMREMIVETGIPEADERAIAEAVIDKGMEPNSDSLRDASDLSEETWEQIRDDARFD